MDDQQDGITAYHGSPHDFNEFDTSKIGTGEGAQAYGHGLYFAEHEPVAKGYRDQLSEGSTHVMFPEGDKDEWGNPMRFHPEELTGHESAAAKAVLNREGNKGQLEWLKKSPIERDDAAKAMRLIRSGKIEKAPAGHMYEVHINAHPHHMLDWDKPLSEQSEHVQGALKGYLKNLGHKTGGDFYQGLVPQFEHKPEQASAWFKSKGIKGIKYLDAGSRGDKAEPTHNYVVFDHNDVHIKRKYAQGGAVEGYEDGGEVDDIPDIKNPVSVFPKPQRMFPEENRPAGGQYLNAKTKEDMTGHKAAQASIGVQPGGRPFFNASADAVEQTGSHGKGNATAKTNLFKQKAGWKWVDAPEDHQDTGTIVSVEHRGHHHYALNAHFPKGVDLARYENSTSEPRLRPTTKGNVTKGDQVGTISVRGKEHPVYNHVIVKADGGDVWDDSRVRRSGEGGTETALDFFQNAPLYKQRMEAQAPQPAPVAAPSTEGKSMPVTAAPPPAIVQPAQPVQQKQEAPQAQGQVGLYAVGTNDPNPDMTVQSAQRIIESSRAMGINPVFLLPNQAGNTQYAQNSRALQKYLDENSIQYQMPQYGDKDPLHMTPSWASGASKSYNAPFLAGDSNSVRLGIVGYGAKGDGKTIVHPESGAVLGRVGANSKAVADELERHLKWQMQNRTQRNTGGPVTVSKGQDTAGNFKKEHEKIHGIPVAVEVKEGHDRVKYEPDGSLKFKAKQYADYGAILGTKDADGMNTDVMVGPHKDSDKAYIIDQRKHSTGKFDEHKVMLGFNKRKKAIKAYTKSYADRHGKDRVQDVVKTDIAGLKKWLKHGNLKVAAAKDALINRALEVVSKKT